MKDPKMTLNPIPGPIQSQILGSIPETRPQANPFPPREHFPESHNWWYCYRIGAVSGRYEGENTDPGVARSVLDLRVDIDPRSTDSPVLNRISGDLYRLYRINFPGRPEISWRVYQESWIVDSPTLNWSRCNVEITGTVRYWKGVHPTTDIRISVPWRTFGAAGPATVGLTNALGHNSNFTCTRISDCFRDMNLEVDVCQSVNAAPILPDYNTHSHSTRPQDLPQRQLTMETAFRDAGICVSVRPEHTILDDSDPEFTSWSPAELHDAMETHFSQMSGRWPNWEMWGLLAGMYDDPGTGGIMYDAREAYGGSGKAPERQGFAVFRNHSWFSQLVAGTPANEEQAFAQRQFLYTWVHEAGHAFNFLHSWNKGRDDALSWMNYPQYVPKFWENFRFRLDDEELTHIRHGDRAAVIMGADAWASGGHFEDNSGAFSELIGEPPLELLVRSKEYFQFLEPVALEIRLRNLFNDLPLNVDLRLNPEHGIVSVFIRRPSGQIVKYKPLLSRLSEPVTHTLHPHNDTVEGPDRISQDIFLSYGGSGFSFDEPGEYVVRAVYEGMGDILIPSNTHRIRIAQPFSRDDERVAQDYFSHETGMSLYLKGSSSPFLKKGMDTLEYIADSHQKSAVGARVALMLAQNLQKPFFRIEDGKLLKVRSADPKEALKLTDNALAQRKREASTFTNLGYHELCRTRADLLTTVGKKAEAKKEITSLVRSLKRGGVNQSVVDEIETYSKNL